MNRRHTITTRPNDYPEHLNPFNEENGDDVKINNKFASTLGRRNSRITSSFRSINSWSMFSSKKSKKEEKPVTQQSTLTKDKFVTLPPKHKSQISDVLAPKAIKSNTIKMNSQDQTRLNPNNELLIADEFKLTPKSARYRRPSDAEQTKPVPEPRVTTGQPPTPLPRKLVPRLEEDIPSTSAERRIRPTTIIPEEEGKYIQQGAKPKKKRRAPLPPTKPPPIIDNTPVNITEREETSQSMSVTSTSDQQCAETSSVVPQDCSTSITCTTAADESCAEPVPLVRSTLQVPRSAPECLAVGDVTPTRSVSPTQDNIQAEPSLEAPTENLPTSKEEEDVLLDEQIIEKVEKLTSLIISS